MNGWEFLEEYKKLDQKLQTSTLIIMLTTSDNPDDKINSVNLVPLRILKPNLLPMR